MEALIGTALTVVAAFGAKSAEAFAQEAGEQAAGAAKALFDRLREWWSREPVAAAAAENLGLDPKKYSPILGELLASDLASDEALAAELQSLVEAVSPHVEVIQRIEIANGVTGADVGRLVRGKIRVEQQITNAQNVIGFKADEIGS